ncbi:MAG: UpxY family transcription antiterminator [Acidobacteria bacterium]|nr:UpxY family transcription antiterminator [Acidobacteriota bacterium]
MSVSEDTGAIDILIPEFVVADQSPWYAIWTRSRAEKSVVEQLERKRIEVFLPTIQRWSRWKDRKKKIDWPLFPGYCFARFDPRVALDVRKCVGVATIISFDGTLAPIPHAEIEAIQRVVSSELQFDACPLLHEGDMVEVIHGPLTGVTGRLIHKGPKTLLLVAITMINRGVEVRLDAADVRKY